MSRMENRTRRRSAARFAVLVAFGVLITLAALTGGGMGAAGAQGVVLTPQAYLALIGNAGASSTPQSPTATVTPTCSATPEPTAAPDTYDQVHLAWTSDSATTLTVLWRTPKADNASAVQYRDLGAPRWLTTPGAIRPAGTSGALHAVELTGLRPATAYEYRVQADGGLWSATFSARTAPAGGAGASASGGAAFDAIFFADTGLVGRSDGLASGTQQVIDEIVKMKPLVLLGGGDYTYFDTDRRYGTYEKAIDAWFNQLQPAAAQAPLMLAYGNHEFELDGGTQPWAQRLPMLPGDDSRRYYSFDVGDAHFVSLFAASDKSGVDDAQLAWLEHDLAAARARGMRWLIPYFHVVMFGDGKNHGENLMVRADLGPVFEQYGVQLAFYAHDQAYERSYPLVDVPKSNRPTSTSLTCYTPADGVVYVKVSPGGKESNISGAFSPFKSAVKPAWTAVRDNTMHHIARLRVASDSVTVEAWGIQGDGSAPILRDSFKVTGDQCP